MFVVIVLLGALLLGSQRGLLIMFVCITTLLGLYLAEDAGLIVYVSEYVPAQGALVVQIFALSFTFIITNLYTRQLMQAVINSRESERRYRDSEEKFRSIVESANEGIIVFQNALRVYYNPRWLTLTGYSAEEYARLPVLNLAHPDDEEQLNQINTQILTGDYFEEQVEYRIIDKSGEIKWLHGNVSQIQWEGSPAGLGLVEDITERKRVAEKLQASENLYKTLFNAASDAIFTLKVTNEGAYFSNCNPRTLEMFGVNADDIIGKSPAAFSPQLQPDGRSSEERVREIVDAALAGEPQFFEWRHCRLDGVHFDAEVAVNRIEVGDQPGLLAIVRDITHRKRAEEKIKRYQENLGELVAERTRELEISTNKLQLITDSMPALIAYINTDYVYEFANAYYQELLQVEPSKVIGKTVKEIIGEDGFAAVKSRYDGAFRGERQEYETTFTLPHGRVGTFHVVYVPHELDGKIDGCFALVQDITQRKKAEEQKVVFEERQRLARDLHDSVTQSLYSLSLLAETGRRAAEAQNFESVAHHVNRLGEVAQLSLKEMRLMIYELRPEVLEQQGLARALQQRLDTVEGRVGVQTNLATNIDINLPSAVEDALYNIALEALNNALKHAAATAVKIKLHQTEAQVIIKIQDNGRGFEMEEIADAGGLGLITMRERAEKLGGSLKVAAIPDEGTAIQAVIPL